MPNQKIKDGKCGWVDCFGAWHPTELDALNAEASKKRYYERDETKIINYDNYDKRAEDAAWQKLDAEKKRKEEANAKKREEERQRMTLKKTKTQKRKERDGELLEILAFSKVKRKPKMLKAPRCQWMTAAIRDFNINGEQIAEHLKNHGYMAKNNKITKEMYLFMKQNPPKKEKLKSEAIEIMETLQKKKIEIRSANEWR